MARRAIATEANKGGLPAVVRTKHSTTTRSPNQPSPLPVLRKPLKYSAHDVEVVLEALWGMFTHTQSKKLMVAVPWDDSDEPQQMALADMVTQMESWLD